MSTVQKILDKFDFEKTYKIMQSLDWKWVGEEVTIAGLKNMAESLLKDAYYYKGNEFPYYVASGGLRAIRYEDEISLEFIPVHTISDIVRVCPCCSREL